MDNQRPAKRLSVQTIGCRLNQYESEKMASDLAVYGLQRVKRNEVADLYIINTCTVTHRADADCRQAIRRAARQNPDSKIVVAGCFVDKDPREVEGMEVVDAIIRNIEKENVAELLSGKFPDFFDTKPATGCSDSITEFHGHNRAWLKVSDGCNQWCSFCILPTVRGRVRNRPAKGIIDEINNLVEHGYNEIVLTGINLGHYKNRKVEPQCKNLAALCRMILEKTDLPRIRLSSLEPQTVRGDLVKLYAEGDPRLCRHWHIPLQSGSSRILKLMRRPYDQNTYIKRVNEIKDSVPNTIIGADVIVGFPGETEEDFKRTQRLAESGLIDYLHVFSYSDRPGTFATENYNEKVDPLQIKERNAILTSISAKLRSDANQRQVGQTLEVISEHRKTENSALYGIADNYIKVKLPDYCQSSRKIVKFKVVSACSDYVEGDLATPARKHVG